MELDKNAAPVKTADIIRITDKGDEVVAYKAPVKQWGIYNGRYNYVTVDFTAVGSPAFIAFIWRFQDQCISHK